VPTIAESGLPGFEFDGWMGLAGPAGLPASTVGRLNSELAKLLAEKDTRARLTEAGLDIAGGSPEQMAATMKDQAARMIRLAKEVGIKPVD